MLILTGITKVFTGTYSLDKAKINMEPSNAKNISQMIIFLIIAINFYILTGIITKTELESGDSTKAGEKPSLNFITTSSFST